MRKNIFQRVGSLFSKKKSVILNTAPNSSFGLENFYDTYNLNTYKESLYLFIGISMIRETVSSIPLEMYQIKNKQGDTEEVYSDPFLDLLERPNQDQTQKEFWKLAIAHYLLAGEAFWYLERSAPGATPTAMANMRPDCVTILFSVGQKEIIGYEYRQANGVILKIAKEDVLHIKNVDPVDPVRGVGVIRPASQRIITEREASKYQSTTFKTQGRPDVAVFTDLDLTEEAIEDARERWHKAFSNNKGSQVAFFGGGTKSLQNLTTNPKEMDFINTQKYLRDDILAALRIPKAMITSDDVNLANSKTARINYIKEACLPVLDTFIDIINNKLLSDMDQDRFIQYDNPVNEDREILLAEATQLKDKGIITVNEARELMSYGPVDGGDVREAGNSNPFGSLGLAFKRNKLRKVAKTILKKRPILVQKFTAIEELTKVIEAEKSVKRSQNSVFNTPELRAGYVKAFNKNVDNKAKIFKNTIDVYNDGFAKRIIKHIEDFGLNATTFFNQSTEIREAKNVFNPLMKNMFSKIGQEALDFVASGFSNKAAEQFHTPEDMLKALEARAEFFIVSMLNTDYDELKSIIVQGMENGSGVEAIGRDIRKYFDDMSVARAKTIARTETGRLMSQATDEAYRQSELVTGKEWLTAGDDRVRDEHILNAGVVVPPGASFPNGESYPGQNTINCRCVLAPAI